MYSGKSPDRIIDKRNKWISRYDAKKTGFRITVNAPIINRYMKPLKNEWFLEVGNAIIRGKDFPVERGYDGKLTAIYGDYMTPVKEKTGYIIHVNKEGYADESIGTSRNR